MKGRRVHATQETLFHIDRFRGQSFECELAATTSKSGRGRIRIRACFSLMPDDLTFKLYQSGSVVAEYETFEDAHEAFMELI